MFVENAGCKTRETRAPQYDLCSSSDALIEFLSSAHLHACGSRSEIRRNAHKADPFCKVVAFRDGVAVQSRAARKKVVERWQMRLILEILNNSLSTAIHFHSRCVTFSNARCHCAAFLTASCLLAPTSQVYRHENLTRVYAHALYLAVLTYSHG